MTFRLLCGLAMYDHHLTVGKPMRRSRSILPLLAASLAACTPAPVAVPEPVNLTVSIPPTQVVQRAAQRLVADGFTITTSDATGGVLTATLTRVGGVARGPFIACRFGEGSIANERGTTTLTVRVTAMAAGAASKVFIATAATNTVIAGILSGSSETDCASEFLGA